MVVVGGGVGQGAEGMWDGGVVGQGCIRGGIGGGGGEEETPSSYGLWSKDQRKSKVMPRKFL